MHATRDVTDILEEVLSLGGRSRSFTRDTPLMGAVPELDSMAVVSLLAAIEERFGILIDDDEIDGSLFATVGTLTDFVEGKAAA